MERTTTPSCANCQRLEAQVDVLQTEVALLRELLAAARKDSTTSSKPPSSDIVKPQPAPSNDGTRRSIGGQPGHPMHHREPFPVEQVTHFEEHTLDGCPCCCGPVHRNGHLARVVQQVDVTKPPLTIECPFSGSDCDRKVSKWTSWSKTKIPRSVLISGY